MPPPEPPPPPWPLEPPPPVLLPPPPLVPPPLDEGWATGADCTGAGADPPELLADAEEELLEGAAPPDVEWVALCFFAGAL